MKKIKICGIRRTEDVEYINEYKPDYMGFIFADTRRYISPEKARILSEKIDKNILKVGVFVNEDVEKVASIASEGTIDIIQLHGDEDAQYISKLRTRLNKGFSECVDKQKSEEFDGKDVEDSKKVQIIKAVRVQTTEDILKADKLDVDYLLLDTYRKGIYGGTGESFGWELIPVHLEHKYFLAGGIDATNLKDALKTGCYGVDISGGVETDGVKDKEKVREVIFYLKADP